ncbi:MAG: PAS domain S-box-containing protein, partial [Candidatus Latescibacterota bacterium]
MSTKILVVEDERIIAEDLKETLQGLFYEVPDIACSGEEAISKAEQLSVDLVLMDIRLSGDMDGIEAAQHIYEHFDIPVIYMTANSDIATLERAKKTRPFGYLLKPFKERELHTTIEISLYRHQMEMQVKSLQIDLQNKVDLLEQQNSEIRQLSRALEQSPVSVAITDTQGKTEYVNQNFIDTTGYSRQESIGQESDLIKSGTDLSPFHQQLKETITAGRTWHGDFCNQRRNGETLWESASISPVRSTSEEITHFVVIKENITEKKERHELQSAC